MSDSQQTDRGILAVAAKGKRVVAGVLLALMFLVVLIGTAELVIVMVREIVASASGLDANSFLLSEASLFAIFGLFLNVLIAVELIETVEVYFREHTLHAETVLLVAIIAVARKAILLDLTYYEPFMVFALSGMIIALGVSYYLVKKTVQPV